MTPLRDRNPFTLGLVTLLGLGLFLGGAAYVSTVSFGVKRYTAELAQTAGLRVGEDVDVAGVPSGSVESIDLVDGMVEVEFTLNKDIRLGSRTSAEVKVATLLGTHSLQVTPAGRDDLAENTIPLARTSVPFNLQDVIDEATETVGQIDPVLLAQALQSVSKTMAASADDIGPALSGVARLSELVATRTDQLGDLMKAIREISAEVEAGTDDLVELMKQANLVIAEITERRTAIRQMLAATKSLSTNISRIIDKTDQDMAPAFAAVNEVVRVLRKENETLTKLIGDMAVTARYLANAGGNGPWIDLFTKYPPLPADDGR